MSGEHGGAEDRGVRRPGGSDFADLLGERAERPGLTGWLETVTDGLSPLWRRRIGGGVVASIGTFLVAVPLYHLYRHTITVDALAGDALPLVIGLGLFGVGSWLAWGSDDVRPLVAAFWVTAGFLGATLVATYVLWLHVSHGHVVESLGYLVVDMAATGAVGGLVISRYDVRSRRQHERLSQRERQLRAVFEGTLDALVIADDEGRYVAVNPAAADLFGVERSELLGRQISDFAASSEAIDAQWEAFLADGAARGEFDIVRADGERRTVAFAATANILPGRHLSALRDVTDRAEREAELSRERARVEFLNRLLRHNVLNGMNLVLAKLDALEPAVPEDRRDDLRVVRHRSDEIVDLIQTARRLATDVSTSVDEETVDVRDPLREAVESVRTAYPAATVECDLPESPTVVHADDMVATVFDNLLTNAVQHNDPETVTVSVGVAVDEETVTVTVADDGEGMSPARLDQLFDDDEFAHTRDWGGFGLSIVQALVEEYGGRVWAAANEPTGTVFSVELRRADATS
ncbi:sensor histidine kinase [Haloplanus sp. C73]|uniref:sensor histidine kinase n=1 Tax=Haloplanus sp. C73 TaxID=3421641 RepID=UPI003EBEB334